MKREIARVARKEIKGEISALRKASASHRNDIAALKKIVKAQDTLLRQFVRMANRADRASTAHHGTSEAAAPSAPRAPRVEAAAFDHQAFAAHRKHLGLTQGQMAKLVGVSALSIYKWESGKVMPRAAQREGVAQALKLGKRKALAIATS
ncbi:helix-turn-helix domain-containing protein [Hydrogenophaga laconesensis]|uniref:DNA-binding XRE family transcriptional regulator n=1 Tax=Hydrogenophaga laconesensis TaxID=1805971 RepID=A0ABU1VGD3_9BURK|nr:helix-turn-helix domain-containing protein [Hydrogenophaga laconesensis]MDR7096539.1 DNA-binding XRE family transcriptional regulator [Hydrogenophaga laconesensis]